MPLFMDYHKGLSVTAEDIRRVHMADEAIQSKYGVVYHQFWVSRQDGTVFCLMEGPDRESCEAVHREAHGNVAGAMIEVETGFYEQLQDRGHVPAEGLVRNMNGHLDDGTRCFLALCIHGVIMIPHAAGYRPVKTPNGARELALRNISQSGGRQVSSGYDDTLIAVFDSSEYAVTCAVNLRRALILQKNTHTNDEWNIAFKIGLASDQPAKGQIDLGSEAMILARRLCSAADVNRLLISSGVEDHCNLREFTDAQDIIRILTKREQDFISRLFAISEEKLSDEHFTVDGLSRTIGISRPQLYRKIVSLTGKSPNDFIRDLRMDKALTLLKRKAGNISEIALEVGYSNPSYFARCFQVRYGCTPSRYFLETT